MFFCHIFNNILLFISYSIFHNIFQTLSKHSFTLKDLNFGVHLSQATTVHAKKPINMKHFPCKEKVNEKNISNFLHITTKQSEILLPVSIKSHPVAGRDAASHPIAGMDAVVPAWMRC